MSGLDYLHSLAQGNRPADDGLLGNARCGWGGGELVSEETILAAFAARPFKLDGKLLSVETTHGAALIGEDRALIADLYAGRIGRLWRVGEGIEQGADAEIHVAFDADMNQARGDVSYRAEDHPSLDAIAGERLLTSSRDLVEQIRSEGKLRVRGFIVRAFGGPKGSAALMSVFTLGNETRRSAGFSYAAVGIDPEFDEVWTVRDQLQPRDWNPRF